MSRRMATTRTSPWIVAGTLLVLLGWAALASAKVARVDAHAAADSARRARPAPAPAAVPSGFVDVIPVTGAITPITAQQIESQIRDSEKDGARALKCPL